MSMKKGVISHDELNGIKLNSWGLTKNKHKHNRFPTPK